MMMMTYLTTLAIVVSLRYFFLDVFHCNIFINNAFKIGNGTSPSELNVRHYIETCVDLLYHNFVINIKKWWMFLCNYTRYVLELLFFEDHLKSLKNYDSDFLRNGVTIEQCCDLL